MANLDRNEDGSFPAFAFPGGYPLFYVTADNGILCPDCANGKNRSIAYTGPSPDGIEDAQWKVMACDVHYEGDPLVCDHCNASIESAYGPEEDDEDEDNDTCNDCGSPLEVCCDGIVRCLHCNPCPACYDGGMDDDEPGEDDITTSDGRTFYQYGKLWLRVSDPEDAPDAIRTKMDEEGFYPSVWSISDHGNAHPFALD